MYFRENHERCNEDHKGSVIIGGRIFINFLFADHVCDIVVNAEEKEEAGDNTTSMDTTCTMYKMEIGHDKTKIMSNNSDGFQREIKIKTKG